MMSVIKKDEQITNISEKFSLALEDNTRAINLFLVVQNKLSNSIDKLDNEISRSISQHSHEHEEILQEMRLGRIGR